MTGLETLLGCLAGEQLIKSFVGGLIANRGDGAVVACGRLIYRQIADDPANPQNHDVLLAVQSAYVRSLHVFGKQCLTRFSPGDGTLAERQAADAIQNAVAQLNPKRPLPPWSPDAALLETEAQAMFAPAGGLANSIAARTWAALVAATGPLPASVEQFFHHGTADMRSWPATFQLLFAEQVKTNPRVAAITTFAGIAELKAQGFDLAARVAELRQEAQAQSTELLAMRDMIIAFWEDLGTQLANVEAQNARRFAESEAAADRRHAETMAAFERRDRSLEQRIAATPDDEPLLRARMQALLVLQPDADIETILGSFTSALVERDALKAELEALRAEDNRITGYVQAAEAAIQAADFSQARDLIDAAIAVHAEREEDARRQRSRLLAVRARTYKAKLDYASILVGLDAAASASPDADVQFALLLEAADTAGEWAGKLPDPVAPRDAVRRWTGLLERIDKAAQPKHWAGGKNNLGNALSTLGERQDDPAALTAAIAAFRDALTVYTRDALPLDWAMTQNNLGNALRTLGERQADPAALTAALNAFRDALTVYTRDALPFDWAMTQNNLGTALQTLGERQDDPAALTAAIAAYRDALAVYTRDALPLQWALTHENCASALKALARLTRDAVPAREAVADLEAALTIFAHPGLAHNRAKAERGLDRARALLAELGG
ncbi:hypothetical protein [Sandarakinorhabdus sp.]|uniref:hypothetical protein n=1 Tax=Sandarakinorhabdus sp. TaxID=1916663 RepID=UPI003F6F2366